VLAQRVDQLEIDVRLVILIARRAHGGQQRDERLAC
jgi:hypothetical protein